MEQPYPGRATIQDNIIDLQIVIPVKRNWFIIIFLGAWLGGWVLGEMFALRAVTALGNNAGRLFLMFWLVGWTIGGFFALRFFLWSVAGNNFNMGGTIRFAYGLKTVKFASGVDEAEGRFIINKLKERNLLSEKNMATL